MSRACRGVRLMLTEALNAAREHLPQMPAVRLPCRRGLETTDGEITPEDVVEAMVGRASLVFGRDE